MGSFLLDLPLELLNMILKYAVEDELWESFDTGIVPKHVVTLPRAFFVSRKLRETAMENLLPSVWVGMRSWSEKSSIEHVQAQSAQLLPRPWLALNAASIVNLTVAVPANHVDLKNASPPGSVRAEAVTISNLFGLANLRRLRVLVQPPLEPQVWSYFYNSLLILGMLFNQKQRPVHLEYVEVFVDVRFNDTYEELGWHRVRLEYGKHTGRFWLLEVYLPLKAFSQDWQSFQFVHELERLSAVKSDIHNLRPALGVHIVSVRKQSPSAEAVLGSPMSHHFRHEERISDNLY